MLKNCAIIPDCGPAPQLIEPKGKGARTEGYEVSLVLLDIFASTVRPGAVLAILIAGQQALFLRRSISNDRLHPFRATTMAANRANVTEFLRRNIITNRINRPHPLVQPRGYCSHLDFTRHLSKRFFGLAGDTHITAHFRSPPIRSCVQASNFTLDHTNEMTCGISYSPPKKRL